jgi:aldehyde dehydrogenase (NAD+)
VKSLHHYIAGRWVAASGNEAPYAVINPATERAVAQILMGTPADVDAAVSAAQAAFPAYAACSLEQRIAHLRRLRAVFERRYAEMVEAITTEMGAPHDLASRSQAACGPGHIDATIEAALQLDWETKIGKTSNVVREPIGVCGLITPWNWPINQIMAKLAPALVAGCTVVLKPSEQAPLSAQLIAEFIDEAALPRGVFNLVHGSGAVVGNAMSAHPDIDLMSFTGSTRAGILVAKAAADSVKRVTQELGGKSANLVFADADLPAAIARGVRSCFNNTGQSCNAPTRMLIESPVYAQAVELAVAAARATRVGDPTRPGDHLGPLASRMQFDKVQACIATGIAEGARLVAGGPGRPDGLPVGFYVRPTLLADVHNQMRIAREEIFGPVLCLMRFETLEQAVSIANDTPFGLAAYVQSGDLDKARAVARRLRAGSVHINGASQGYAEPFGGYRQSGNGRECGVYGLLEFLELKSINGYYAA